MIVKSVLELEEVGRQAAFDVIDEGFLGGSWSCNLVEDSGGNDPGEGAVSSSKSKVELPIGSAPHL